MSYATNTAVDESEKQLRLFEGDRIRWTGTDEDAPPRVILNATAGGFSRIYIHETEGICFAPEECTPENVAAHFVEISDTVGQHLYEGGGEQVMKFVTKAAAVAGVKLG